MARVFKISAESDIPDWLINEPPAPKFAGNQAAAERITKLPTTLDEDGLNGEFNEIEKCASAKSPYYANTHWDDSTKQRIREFAFVSGVKIVNVDPKDVDIVTMSVKEVIKTASGAPKMTVDSKVIDPFRFEEKGNMDHIYKGDKWESLKPEAKLSAPVPIMGSNACIRLSGNEDYRKSSSLKIKPGQNSITDPDAIKNLSATVDTGTRLKAERLEREETRKTEARAWELDVLKAAQASQKVEGKLGESSIEFSTVGKLGMTGAAPAHSGVFGKSRDIPEKSSKELIAEANQQRKADIQRETADENTWDSLQGAARHEINDVFAQELEKALKKTETAK